MSRDARVGLFILAVGIAPSLIKKSKPLARYLGGQFIRFGEYMKQDTEEAAPVEPPPISEEAPAKSSAKKAKPSKKDETPTPEAD